MQTVTWNPQRELWETEQANPFSETWPTSGMTRSGRLSPLPMSAHPTAANKYLLLPTPQTINRCSRRAMLGIVDAKGNRNHWTSPGLEQALEIAQGILPREFNSWDEVPGASQAMRPGGDETGVALGWFDATEGGNP